jgi:transcription elongation factor GreA
MNKNKLTKARYEELEQELHYLETVRDKEVAEKLKEARSFGDLSENSEYDEAKNEQGKVHSRKVEIREILGNSEILKDIDKAEHVVIGVTVTVAVLNDDETVKEERTYRIVGTHEADPRKGKMSEDSPVGKALLTHKTDDIIEVEVPSGILTLKIIKIDV